MLFLCLLKSLFQQFIIEYIHIYYIRKKMNMQINFIFKTLFKILEKFCLPPKHLCFRWRHLMPTNWILFPFAHPTNSFSLLSGLPPSSITGGVNNALLARPSAIRQTFKFIELSLVVIILIDFAAWMYSFYQSVVSDGQTLQKERKTYHHWSADDMAPNQARTIYLRTEIASSSVWK